jgi:hypothetical protein
MDALFRYLARVFLEFLIRLFRIRRERRWPSAEGTIIRAVAAEVDDGWAPVVFYSFAVNSREYFGDLQGTAGIDAPKRASEIRPGDHIVVRFKPGNPSRNAALNDDNRERLPFTIAE